MTSPRVISTGSASSFARDSWEYTSFCCSFVKCEGRRTLELNLERSSDNSGLEGGRKFGRAPYVRVSMVQSRKAIRE